MDNNIKKIWQAQADKVINNLRQRQMDGVYFSNKEDALKSILEECKNYSPIAWAGSMTLDEIGLRDALRKGDYKLLDYYDTKLSKEEQTELRRKTLHSDLLLTSTNAITINGELINIDGMSNRVAGMMFGPNKVFIVAGMNKLVYTVDAGIERTMNFAAPVNTIRIDRKTPCRETFECEDCRSKDRICCNLVITSFQSVKDRIKVFLIGETLGY